MNRFPIKYAGLAVVAGLLCSTSSWAEPRFAQMYKQHYGYMPGCNACHTDGGGSDPNNFGEAFKKAGSTSAAFVSVADADADGDGVSNQQEIVTKANPGDAKSTPKSPGDWLDTANLIPREVQKLFPGVTQYKPMDAILTAAEIERAAGMGVTLGGEDSNTIYIPVSDGKAAGTAVIVPCHFGDKQFFVVLATDRALKVIKAGPVHAVGVAGADNPAIYAQVVGKDVADLPTGLGKSVDDAILAGLKKAGTLLLVRLKK